MSIGIASKYTSSNSFLNSSFDRTTLLFLWLAGCVAPLVVIVERIEEEEAMLGKEFNEKWTQYRKRTWKLVPWIW